jgi:hypothetical protein
VTASSRSKRARKTSTIALGLYAGIVLSAFVVLLAFVGLTPALSWVPEIPLLLVSVLVPLVGYAVTGYRAGRRSGRVTGGVIAGVVAGAVSGLAGGLSFVLFEKPLLNIPVGTALGCIAGAVWGAAGAVLGARARDGR